MDIKNKMIFAVLSFSIVALIMTAYSNTVQSAFITTFAEENQTGTENEAEVNADIEQENKCKKDTECENENKINNQLSITNITQTTTGESGPTTLNVIKILNCFDGSITNPISCNTLGPEDFTIAVTGNNPSPSQFPGSSGGTLVTLGAGEYTVDESVQLGFGTDLDVSVSGDCELNQQAKKIEGNISEGETQTCTITNNVIFTE